MFSGNGCNKKNVTYLSISFCFECIYMLYLCFYLFLSKTYFSFFTFQMCFLNIYQKWVWNFTKEFLAVKHAALYKQKGVLILIKLFSKHNMDIALEILNTKKDWLLVFSNAFYLHNCVQDLISTHSMFCRGLDFRPVLKLWNQIQRL